MAKRRGHRCRSFSEGDVHARVKRLKNDKESAQHLGTSAEAVAHFQALQASASAAVVADVFEWLGDAVIGELVGRCLLSQFHCAPLSARVFRNLRLAVVANRNLAQAYDAMGYAALRRRSFREDGGVNAGNRTVKMKQRADVVEAVIGELVLKLHEQKGKLKLADGYRAHLDAVVATMLHLHFADRTRAAEEKGETMLEAKGPLSVAFNPFACLPDEQLDETTGELVVSEGVFEHEALEEEEQEEERPCAGFTAEYKGGEKGNTPHHSFVKPATAVGPVDVVKSPSIEQCVQLAMLQLDENHILRTSREIFEVFKIYGMAVLSERMSLSLALPHVSLGPGHQIKRSTMVTPARLTRQRQLVLSVANLAACATSLGIAEAVAYEEDRRGDDEDVAARRQQEEHGRANTLRAFVGFHSAVATTSSIAKCRSNLLVDAICTALYDAAFASESEFSASALRSSNVPEREPLVAMMRSVGEARMFMNSKTCDELHARGERPESAAAAIKREQKRKSSLLLRHCDSNMLEDLFETLNEEQEARRKRSEVTPPPQKQRKRKAKKKNACDSIAVNAGCITHNLERFLHRRFLFCLEEIVVLFAQRKTEACRAQMAVFEQELEPCVEQPQFRKWEVTTSTLTLAMRDGFFRMLLHDVCQFHAVVSSSRNTRDGTRITQLRLPLHYTWANIAIRITTEQQARS
uniref:RNase III domain-containing protein n=1 Tax=Phytophthora ramorum TaxID=164328 RepID=H3GRJ1_PHYRM